MYFEGDTLNHVSLLVWHQRRFDRVKRSQLANHVHPCELDIAAVPQLFHYESVQIVPFALSNTSSSTVAFTNDILDYTCLTCESEASQRSENGGIIRLPITFRTSTVALEKVAFVFKANSGVILNFWLKYKNAY